MLNKSVLALCLLGAMSAAYAAAPSDKQVKQALYDRYATAPASAELRKALDTEVAVGACEPVAEQYRCQIENKALGTAIPMVFAYDKAADKWTFVKEITQ